jgi:hypothetical protein
VVTVDFAAKAINFSVPDEHRSLQRWYDAMSSRSSMAGRSQLRSANRRRQGE